VGRRHDRLVTGSAPAIALVLEDYGSLVRHELPLPAIGTTDALLRVEACGLCGTDHEVYTGRMRWPTGFVPGHETVGVIERIGHHAAARWGVSHGDRVAVVNRRACRDCGPCRDGDLARCARYGPWASYGMVPIVEPPGLWGGYATHHYLAEHSVVHRVPAGLDPVLATMFNPLAAGVTWGVEEPDTRPGNVVAVLGAGMRGLCAAIAAKAAGAATANAPSAFGQAIELAALGGRVVVAGMRGARVTAACEPDLIVSKQLRLTGVRGVSTTAPRAALDLLGSGRFDLTNVSRRVAGFSDVAELLLTMAGERGADPPLHAVFVPDEGAAP
jgi:alcohol dehydrogenase